MKLTGANQNILRELIKDIELLETILHKSFYKYRLNEVEGTGGAEWFSNECLFNINYKVGLLD
jgi:hypothetical protein